VACNSSHPSRPGTFRQVVRPALEVRLAHQPQYPLAFDVLGIAVPDKDLDPELVEDESKARWSWLWPSWMRFSSRPADPGSTKIGLLQTIPGVGRRWPKSSSLRPARTCHATPPSPIWRPGPGWCRR
jgi:hypothetical protein